MVTFMKAAGFTVLMMILGMGLAFGISLLIPSPPSPLGFRESCEAFCREVGGTLLEVNGHPHDRDPECICAVYDHPLPEGASR